MYSVKDLSRVAVFPLDVSPTILVPFYDEDSSILFLYGRVSKSQKIFYMEFGLIFIYFSLQINFCLEL